MKYNCSKDLNTDLAKPSMRYDSSRFAKLAASYSYRPRNSTSTDFARSRRSRFTSSLQQYTTYTYSTVSRLQSTTYRFHSSTRMSRITSIVCVHHYESEIVHFDFPGSGQGHAVPVPPAEVLELPESTGTAALLENLHVDVQVYSATNRRQIDRNLSQIEVASSYVPFYTVAERSETRTRVTRAHVPPRELQHTESSAALVENLHVITPQVSLTTRQVNSIVRRVCSIVMIMRRIYHPMHQIYSAVPRVYSDILHLRLTSLYHEFTSFHHNFITLHYEGTTLYNEFTDLYREITHLLFRRNPR